MAITEKQKRQLEQALSDPTACGWVRVGDDILPMRRSVARATETNPRPAPVERQVRDGVRSIC